MLVFGRLLAGLSAGLTTSVVPMYLTELAPLHLKGATGVLCPLGVTIGVLVGQTLSMHDILVLQKLRNVKKEMLQDEIEELKIEEEDNQSAGASWNIGKVMTDRTLLLPLLLVCFLQAGQQLSGINAVFYYSSTIFHKAGLSVAASELATMGAGICNFFMAVLSIPITSNFNRRSCALLSMGTSAFFLIILAIANIPSVNAYSWVRYISIVGVLGFVICYGLGVGPIPYFIGSELFEVGPRPSAMALGSMSNWGANFIIGLTFPTMQSCIGPAASFFIFAAFLVALFIFVKMYLPETRGKDSSEIAEICRNGFASKPLESRIRVPRNDNEAKTIEDKLQA
ncbi:hypothetical protein NQ314_003184 [Rhamnusium bicolor]|uniref:Major facilitator superfamily (MFS) profile domain-containing protein n=1 Tax=Rhamnusium bicolor TaxID=1586634 RepID=A0AAV8ZMC3_9CUCU|nr:hypothetical protein NQ314_003184 [Rhamnusium bicolor]